MSPGSAPLKENLAAALLRLSGFHPDRPFLDPMCGSGTLLIEAALAAHRLAPGLLRPRFGFERWASFDDAERRSVLELRAEARSLGRRAPAPLFGSDVDPAALDAARANATRAGVEIELGSRPLAEQMPVAPGGALVTNPPYGRRLPNQPELGRELARLVDRLADQHVGVFLAEEQPLARTRRKPKLYSLYNGDIACVLRVYAPFTP